MGKKNEMNTDENTLKNYALKLISIRPRSQKEISDKLQIFAGRHRIPREIIEKVHSYLLDKNFINDHDFVKWWIEQRQAFRPKGKIVLMLELLAKGVDRDSIDEELNTENEEKSEYQSALNLLRKKSLKWNNLGILQKKKKMSDFLLRRGFSFEIVYQAIDSLLQKN